MTDFSSKELLYTYGNISYYIERSTRCPTTGDYVPRFQNDIPGVCPSCRHNSYPNKDHCEEITKLVTTRKFFFGLFEKEISREDWISHDAA